MLVTKNYAAKIRGWIAENATGWEKDPETFEEAAQELARQFVSYLGGGEVVLSGRCWAIQHQSMEEAFKEWGAGLPNGIFDEIFYNNDARCVVRGWLDQSYEKAFSYDLSAAESFACHIIYRLVSDAIKAEIMRTR